MDKFNKLSDKLNDPSLRPFREDLSSAEVELGNLYQKQKIAHDILVLNLREEIPILASLEENFRIAICKGWQVAYTIVPQPSCFEVDPIERN